MHFVYFLVDPRDNHIFYVGQTTNPGKRLKSHIRGALAYKGHNPRKEARIRAIAVQGLDVYMEIHCKVYSKLDADLHETELIHTLPGLTNLDKGRVTYQPRNKVNRWHSNQLVLA
jgi:hypothetical protein